MTREQTLEALLREALETMRSCRAADLSRYGLYPVPPQDLIDRIDSALASPTQGAVQMDGRDFYELCQQYRHAKHDPVTEFTAIKEYIATGRLPWPSYDAPAAQGEQNNTAPHATPIFGEEEYPVAAPQERL